LLSSRNGLAVGSALTLSCTFVGETYMAGGAVAAMRKPCGSQFQSGFRGTALRAWICFVYALDGAHVTTLAIGATGRLFWLLRSQSRRPPPIVNFNKS